MSQKGAQFCRFVRFCQSAEENKNRLSRITRSCDGADLHSRGAPFPRRGDTARVSTARWRWRAPRARGFGSPPRPAARRPPRALGRREARASAPRRQKLGFREPGSGATTATRAPSHVIRESRVSESSRAVARGGSTARTPRPCRRSRRTNPMNDRLVSTTTRRRRRSRRRSPRSTRPLPLAAFCALWA